MPPARRASATGCKPGKSVRDVSFGNLFYADIAKQSYAEFAALKRQGKCPDTSVSRSIWCPPIR